MAKLSDTGIKIQNEKVYSSYYGKACKIYPDYRLVAVSMNVPDNFKGEVLRCLAPSQSLVYGYKYYTMSEQKYTEAYRREILDKLDVREIYNKLKGKIILCYCGPGQFCHRHLIMNWLTEQLGEQYIGGEV